MGFSLKKYSEKLQNKNKKGERRDESKIRLRRVNDQIKREIVNKKMNKSCWS